MVDQVDGELPYWQRKTLADMTPEEWDALCDGCGRCCLHKLEDEDGAVFYTNVACRLLDLRRCRCRHYTQRQRMVADCIAFSPDKLKEVHWLPGTCSYRLIGEGKPLPWWHPLVSGSRETVHTSGASVRGRAIPEEQVDPDHLESFVVSLFEWPVAKEPPGNK